MRIHERQKETGSVKYLYSLNDSYRNWRVYVLSWIDNAKKNLKIIFHNLFEK
jgi:hypothetical protein